jgi:DNA-binding NarL/FixJ family response regulator
MPQRHDQNILTARQVEVLTLLSKGLTYAEAASILNLSSKTIPIHVGNIYRKLQVKNRTEALSEAVSLGILP